jgi:hypothetical protein
MMLRIIQHIVAAHYGCLCSHPVHTLPCHSAPPLLPTAVEVGAFMVRYNDIGFLFPDCAHGHASNARPHINAHPCVKRASNTCPGVKCAPAHRTRSSGTFCTNREKCIGRCLRTVCTLGCLLLTAQFSSCLGPAEKAVYPRQYLRPRRHRAARRLAPPTAGRSGPPDSETFAKGTAPHAICALRLRPLLGYEIVHWDPTEPPSSSAPYNNEFDTNQTSYRCEHHFTLSAHDLTPCEDHTSGCDVTHHTQTTAKIHDITSLRDL